MVMGKQIVSVVYDVIESHSCRFHNETITLSYCFRIILIMILK